MKLQPEDAREIFEALGEVEARRAGRIFMYSVERMSSEEVNGFVVSTEPGRLVMGVAVVLKGMDTVEHVEVPWDDITRFAMLNPE